MSVLIDAATEHIAIADGAKWTWTPVTQARSLSVWWYTTSLPNADNEHQTVLRLDQSGGNKALFSIAYSGGLRMMVLIYNTSMTLIGYMTAPVTLAINTWYHLVWIAGASGGGSLYINKTAQTVTYSSWDDTTEINPGSIRIGDGSAVYDNMRVGHLAWFDRLLSSDEVTALYEDPAKAVKTSLVDNLLAYFPLDEGAGTTAYDKDPNAPTDGTLTNSPTWAANPPLAKQGGLFIPQKQIMTPVPYRAFG